MKPITKDNNYFSKRNISSISDYKQCLERFSSNFENEVSLNTKTLIFLDTNVLLRYYSISFTAREKLFDFIKTNSKRIVLSSQVQYEFIKNREDVIQRFFEQVTNKIPKDFNSDVMNKMNNFLEQHKIVLKDYPFVETGITKQKDDLEELLQKLNETAEQKRKEHVDLIVKDKFLDLLATCISYDSLSNDELELIRKDFDVLGKAISPENMDSMLNKPYSVFPGLGDIKNKPEDPYGDYIIFHEMMKYMLNQKLDVVFLTFDNTKGDWMTKTRSPHLHYTQNMYANTGQILYILDAERTLEDLLNVNIESLVSTDTTSIEKRKISIELLQELMERNAAFAHFERGTFTELIVQELTLNGYKHIDEIERDVQRASIAALEYNRANGQGLNTLGLLRAALKIANPNYNIMILKNGTKEFQNESRQRKYAKYRHLLTE